MSRHRHRSRGQALVEFALAFPIVVLLLFSLFDIGRYVIAYTSLTNAAREGARLAIVNQDEAMVRQRVREQAPVAGPTDADITVTFEKPGSVALSDDCGADIAVGCLATVEVRAAMAPITPIIGSLVGPISFTAQSRVQITFECPNPDVPAYVSSASCPKQP